MSTTSSQPTAARAPGSANSNRALPESGRKSGFSFQSRTAKDTSISEAITSSTPATGCKDGRGTSRSRLRHRNRHRGNERFRGSPRSHADGGLRAARWLSSSQGYRNADQRRSDRPPLFLYHCAESASATMKPESGPTWFRHVPAVRWLADYRVEWLASDAIAGATLAAYAIPVSLAYAGLAGLPPQAGIYGYLLGGLGYALLGSSRQLAIGPTSAISLMI